MHSAAEDPGCCACPSTPAAACVSHHRHLPPAADLATEVDAGESLISKDVNGFIQKISVVGDRASGAC
jgi:hypothetical protein